MENIRNVATHIHLELGNWGRNRIVYLLYAIWRDMRNAFFPLKFREKNPCGSSSM